MNHCSSNNLPSACILVILLCSSLTRMQTVHVLFLCSSVFLCILVFFTCFCCLYLFFAIFIFFCMFFFMFVFYVVFMFFCLLYFSCLFLFCLYGFLIAGLRTRCCVLRTPLHNCSSVPRLMRARNRPMRAFSL